MKSFFLVLVSLYLVETIAMLVGFKDISFSFLDISTINQLINYLILMTAVFVTYIVLNKLSDLIKPTQKVN